MPLHLHGHPWSQNVQKVRFLLAELHEPYELREVPFGLERPAWHTAVNPLGGMPALVEDGLVLAESHAILRYLAARAGRDDLYPADLVERARVDWLLEVIATTLRPALREFDHDVFGFRLRRGIRAERPAADGGAAALAAVTPTLRAVERLLGPPPFAVLGRFTLADVAAAPTLNRLLASGLDLSGLDRLAAWGRAALARPSWAGVGAEAGVKEG
jgi:glutathione S-transferase